MGPGVVDQVLQVAQPTGQPRLRNRAPGRVVGIFCGEAGRCEMLRGELQGSRGLLEGGLASHRTFGAQPSAHGVGSMWKSPFYGVAPSDPPSSRRATRLISLIATVAASVWPGPVSASDLFAINTPTVVAGGGLGDGGPATAAGVLPQDVTVARDGAVYIADEQFNRVRVVSPDGVIQTVAGSGQYGYNGSGRPALGSALGIAASVAVGPEGTLWLVDLANRQIRFVDRDGLLRTFAVPDSPLFSSVPGTFAPYSIDVDPAGRVYVADRGTNVVWQIDPDGAGRRVAGNGTRGYAGDGGLSALGQLADPRAVAVGPDGTIWIADTGNRRVRSVVGGRLSTVAGMGTESGAESDKLDGEGGPGPSPASALEIGIKPVDVAADATGRLLILDESGQRVLRLDADGILTTVAEFGPGSEVAALSVGPDGVIAVADRGRRVVVAVDPATGDRQVLAGNGTARASGDGQAAVNASLYRPSAPTAGSDGSLYLADELNHVVRRIGADGVIEHVAGTGTAGYGGDGGRSPSALLDHPASVVANQAGQIYVADRQNHRVRRIDRDGTIETVVGTGVGGYAGDGGPAIEAQLSLPASVALDEKGRLLIADSGNGRVRRLESDGTIITVAGRGELPTAPGSALNESGSSAFAGDGGPAQHSRLVRPVDARSDGNGGVLIADAGAHRVYRVDEAGYLWVVAGTGEAGRGGDGTIGTRAALNSPASVEPDGAAGAFIADAGNQRVVHVDGSGVLRELAVDGLGTPGGVVRSADGAGLLISDVLAHRILYLPVQRLLAPLSERVHVADPSLAPEALAGVAVPDLLEVIYDPVSDRAYLTHSAGIDVVAATGQRQLFADVVTRSYRAIPAAGAHGQGLVLVAPPQVGPNKPLTLIEPGTSGSPLFFPLDYSFGGAGAVTANAVGDLFLHQPGRVLRLPADRLLNIPGFAGAAGEVGVAQGGLEEFAALPDGPALLAADEASVFVALINSRSLLRLRDLDGDGLAAGVTDGLAEQEIVAPLPGRPVALATVRGAALVAVAGGRIYRVDPTGQTALVAEGFAPEILSLSAGPHGSLLVLEGDDAGGRLVRLAPVVPSLSLWPAVLDFGDSPVGAVFERTLVLRNEGLTRLTVRGESGQGESGQSESVAGLPEALELEPNQTVEIPVTLSASRRGIREARVTWRDVAGDQVLAEMPVRIRGIGPAVEVQGELNLGTAWIGGDLTRYVVLTNAGELPLSIEHLDLAPFEEAPPPGVAGDIGEVAEGESAAGSGAWLSARLDPFRAEVVAGEPIPPGGQVRVRVQISPTARRSSSALLRVHTSDPDQPVHDVALTGMGGRGQLQIHRVDLGSARVGQHLRQELELTNVGELLLRIENLLTGTPQLIVTPRRLYLEPGETQVLVLDFRPRRHGTVEGTFSFYTNDPVNRYWRLPYLGRGVSGLLELGAVSHAFGPTPVGETRTWEVEVASRHTRQVSVSAKIGGQQFRVVQQPRRLSPDATGKVVVAFRPTRSGLSRGVLVLETDLPEAPRIEIPLTGRGQVATRVSLQTPPEPVALWPDELLEISVRVDQAEALRGLALELAASTDAELAGFAVGRNSLLRTAGDEPLILVGTDPGGRDQVGLFVVGRYAAEGVSGAGALGKLQLRVLDFSRGLVDLSLARAIARSPGGTSDTLAAVAAIEIAVSLKGDLNGDGILTEEDVNLLAAAQGTPVTGDTDRWDLDGNGAIGPLDVELLLGHLSPEARGKAAAAIGEGDQPDAVSLQAPYPNPFNAETVLVYSLPEAQSVDLSVYNLLGQRVRQLVQGVRAAGRHAVNWDGRDARGQTLTSGTYFIVLVAAGESHIHRALLLQ